MALSTAGSEAGFQESKRTINPGENNRRPRQMLEISIMHGAAAGSSGNFGGGDVSESSFLLRYNLFVPLSQKWFLRGGPTWNAYYFDSDNPLVPNQLHKFVFDIGTGFKLSDRWTVVGWISSGPASDLDSLDLDDFNFTAIVAAMWKHSDYWEVLIGARFSLYANYPILPAAGFKWKFAPDWELDLTAPRPEVVWSATEKLKLKAGAAFVGGTFRVGEDFGKSLGCRDLANDWLGFREIQTYAATELTIRKGASFRIEAGWIVYREFEFLESDASLKLDGGFYGAAMVNLAF